MRPSSSHPLVAVAAFATCIACLPVTHLSAQERLDRAEGRSPERESASRFEGHIETDRDSFTPSARTANPGRLILESSYSFTDNRQAADGHSFPELLMRFGASERIELRLGWNYEVGGNSNSVSSAESAEEPGRSRIERESNLLCGLKLQVTRQADWLPESCLILQSLTPTQGPEKATQIDPAFVAGWEFPHEMKLDACLRYVTSSEEGDRFAMLAPSIVVRKSIRERWNLHAEYFGLYSHDRRENFQKHYFSPGVHFLVTENLEIGVRTGWGLNDQSARFFSNVGVGWRF